MDKKDINKNNNSNMSTLLEERLYDSFFQIPNTTIDRIEIYNPNTLNYNQEIKLFVGIRDIDDVEKRKTIEMTNIKISHLLNHHEINSNLLMLKLYNNRYVNNQYYKLNNLPPKLQILIIYNIDEPLDNLPTCLKILDIRTVISHNLDNLPGCLKVLQIYKFNGKMDDLPTSLEKLYIVNPCHSQELQNLPRFLNSFAFPDEFNSKIDFSSCPNIKFVWFNTNNNNLRRKLLNLYPKITYMDITDFDPKISYRQEMTNILGYDCDVPNGVSLIYNNNFDNDLDSVDESIDSCYCSDY